MFKPSTKKIEMLQKSFPDKIKGLEVVFSAPTNVYIDYANVKPWSKKLGWHVDIERLKQLLDSFENVNKVKLYYGTMVGDQFSEDFIKRAQGLGYEVIAKPVKLMKMSIDTSSIALNSPDLLKDFIRLPLLQKLKIETVELLNNELKLLNQQGILHIEDKKCNFDVEMGRDMLRDYDNNGVENFVLWSGDSDFAEPIAQLLEDKKIVVLFATTRRVATELNNLRSKGLKIFDIQKIREFICYKREMTTS